MVETLEDLARMLRELRRRQARDRKDSEQTYRELAAKTGWSIGIIAGYFAGRTLPPTDRFDILIALLGASPAEQGALATLRDQIAEQRRTTPAAVTSWPKPQQLPADIYRFSGREAELAALSQQDTVTVISGTAGVGKTALAVHWARRVASRFPDGQLYVNLRGFDGSGPVVTATQAVRGFLDALGVTRIPMEEEAQVGLYRSILADRKVLVVLDNARDTDQVRPLLPGSPHCLTVVTSRNRLSSLVVNEGAQPLALDLPSAEEARQILAARLGPQTTDAEPDAVEELIVRCARLPLALAIVAARARANPAQPLAELAAELRGLDAFADEDATANVRAVFSHSYRNLSPAAASLFRLLGMHPGPDVTAAAAASLAGLGSVRPALAELVRASLLNEHQPGRYAFHDLLRAYAIEQAEAADPAGDRRAAVRRTLDHYLHSAHVASLMMYPQRDPIALQPPTPEVTRESFGDIDHARSWFVTEQSVLSSVIALGAAERFAAQTWQLAWAIADVLDWRGQWHDLVSTQTTAMAAAQAADDRIGLAQTHRLLARAYIRLGRWDEAETLLHQAVELFHGIGDRLGEANSHIALSRVHEQYGRLPAALDHSQQALALFQAAGHKAGEARSLNAVGWYHTLIGSHAEAIECCTQALAVHDELGSRFGQAPAWDSLGYAHQQLGQHEEATRCYENAIRLYREVGDRYHEADTLVHLGDNHLAVAELTEAAACWRDALRILDELNHPAAADVRPKLKQIEEQRP